MSESYCQNGKRLMEILAIEVSAAKGRPPDALEVFEVAETVSELKDHVTVFRICTRPLWMRC
jgi:hypothetical protein